MEELSFEEKYNLEIVLVVDSFSVEYDGCGSHQMRISAVTDLEQLQDLYKRLKQVKGINN